ncbi:shikimate dehydrogenase [Paenibacillus sp. IHBB 10380]|uniref:shikimate dehydrogenase n=1 Tax=Paenibacillus sp. IHBB 10380 TaxID=1566358 RepID=UPI0005CFC6AD|nr:shikimate dehydrogenase [Paenibacillus sp. IHBB 10380]AJS57643.1 shikimate dehydrogenase [Paenibacillus sp. IHBB 10380]
MKELWSDIPTNGDSMLLAVIGDPIRHSKSPAMHNAALAALGIEGEYWPLHVVRDDLGHAINQIKKLGFRGINVTIPHKIEVMAYLDIIDDSAHIIGAVNTIVNNNGVLTGYNTDGIGYVRSLKDEAMADLCGKRIMVLGAGGAARGIIHALSQEDPETLIIANRSEDKAIQMENEWKSLVSIRGISMDKVSSYLPDMDVIINTTSVGMYPHISAVPIDPDGIPSGIVVSDLIYNPLNTELLKRSQDRGCIIHGGLGMFVNQGAYALEYWTGVPAPVEVMRQAVLDSLQS